MAKKSKGRASATKARKSPPKPKPHKPAASPGYSLLEALKPGRSALIQSQLERNKNEQRRAKESLKRLQSSEKRLRESLELSQAESRRNLERMQRYVLVDSKTRRYVDTTTGEIISRREQVKRTSGKTPEAKALDNLLGRARGRTTAEGREKLRLDVDRRGRQKAFAEAYKEQKARELGVDPKDIKIRGDSATAMEFKQLTRGVEKIRKSVRAGSATKEQRARYVDSLILLGIIDANKREEWVRHYGASRT